MLKNKCESPVNVNQPIIIETIINKKISLEFFSDIYMVNLISSSDEHVDL